MYKSMYQSMYQAMYQADSTIQARKLSHSELAMRAAKGMGRSKHKEKTGRVVCHHLLKMLESADRAQNAQNAQNKPLETSGAQGTSGLRRHNHAEQYSLHL